MYYWVIYDITKDRTRLKVARACKRAGLDRVQRSVFLGRLHRKTLLALRTEFNRLVNWRTDRVFFVPMSSRDARRIARTGPKRQPPLVRGLPQPAWY
jgi:CRISPR-associated protein Cas2